MCGRYRLTRSDKRLNETFDAEGDFDIVPRYNIAPSQPVLTIRQEPGQRRQFSTMRWGLLPSWAKDPNIGFKTINARAETVQTTPSFRDPFKSQRCLIPADGFYEWARNGKTKQPYCFEVGEAEVFAFAGLWDRWLDPNGSVLESCTILTTTPNQLLTNFHDRMPVSVNTAISALNGTGPSRRGTMSTAGRARIAAAQRARWAKLKGKVVSITAHKKRKLSAAALAHIRAARRHAGRNGGRSAELRGQQCVQFPPFLGEQ